MTDVKVDLESGRPEGALHHGVGTVPRLTRVNDESRGQAIPDTTAPSSWSSSSSTSSPVEEKAVSPRSGPRPAVTGIVPGDWRSFFSVYRCLNILVLAMNATSIAVLGFQGKLCCMLPSAPATAMSINVGAAVLIRQELVINALFWSAGRCPRSWPLGVRRHIAKIYHLGGGHSGAGMSALLWLVPFHLSLTHTFRQGSLHARRTIITTVSVALEVLLVSIVVMAHPYIRMRQHDAFEFVHRLAGWISLILFWVLLGILTQAGLEDAAGASSFRSAVVSSPVFWTLLSTTTSVALPWLSLRKVAVHAHPLSDHAVRLDFDYTRPPVCAAVRLSDRPLVEWHAFAGIPHRHGEGFSVLVSRAGDWTSRLIQRPPTRMWVRGTPALGLLHLARMFGKVVLVATGSGIGPVMCLLGEPHLTCRILWSTRDPELTYSTAVVEDVRRADPAAMIINTTNDGRPDLTRHAYEMYMTSGAEAVFLISNPRVTRSTVHDLELRGVPVFAPIFDS